jgi:hypothetical protein
VAELMIVIPAVVVAVIAVAFMARTASIAMLEVKDIAIRSLRAGRVIQSDEESDLLSQYELEKRRRLELAREAVMHGESDGQGTD